MECAEELAGSLPPHLERCPTASCCTTHAKPISASPQALEPACWAALLKGRKAVLAGDHLQAR